MKPESSLATVLFTDISGSTEKAAELGNRRWRELLQDHNALVRREVRRFGGREVNTAGDGFLITFDRPAKAIGCACAIATLSASSVSRSAPACTWARWK
jgi:class 3 adenylate cyclase